ncbi:SDR family oxidoreductase [Roseicyclus sp. F158]|uniref:SDR family oxidoreductase n=1 Tax=Tropicimonas omnivorans TaxID=3075590 RepID=A0ABU3DHJ5_9RHOB|nr:SDR family oxidoreductase [Roseicyclus sp. F158]MDT0682632.1 SDR family oxidoreductase [Roseicyclus sp. F158]
MADDTSHDPQRRLVLGGLAGGAAAAGLAGPAAAQTSGETPAASPLTEMRDPQDAYPQPPFERQQQDWPGLASEMTPVPDHGEESYVGSGRLTGRRALITGGDSGIGRAAAIAYAREGADVAINYLPAEEQDAQQVIALIEAEGRTAVAIPGDITDAAFCRDLVERAVEGLGGLDILVNNAGYQQFAESIEDISEEDFDTTMKTNIYAPFRITKAALPHMEAGSAIVITTSVVAEDPPEILFDYAQTKAANIIFAKALAKQLGPRGIRVNAVAPGPFWTPLQVVGGQPADAIPEFGASTVIGRPGQPVEIAPLYVLAASSEASYSTGQVFEATGG